MPGLFFTFWKKKKYWEWGYGNYIVYNFGHILIISIIREYFYGRKT